MNTLIICLFITILMPYCLKVIVGKYMARDKGGYDNHYPRVQQARLHGIGARAVAAQQNGFESLIVFATAAITALATGHVGTGVKFLAVFYVCSRVAYYYLYLQDKATMRSIVWFLGFLSCLSILIICLYA